MKTNRIIRVLSLFLLMTGAFATYSQDDQSELPGDNFSLEGALELFKKSTSPEDFERLLNSPDSKVNNLDLNGDNKTDYIRVINRNEGNVHIFILQALISDKESQDVAVIELEKQANGKAVLQITGDADIYGMETIIEPTEEVRVNAGTSTARNVVNVWTWPSVQYVYSPYYTVWVSPWTWAALPIWWHPWAPVSYYVYDPWWVPYRPYYSVCYSHRIVYAPRIYVPVRTTSVVVYNRHHTQIAHYRSSNNGYHGNRNRSNGYDNRDRNSYNNGRRSYNGEDGNRYSRSLADRTTREQPQNQGGRTSSDHHNFSSDNSRSSSDFRRSPDSNTRSSWSAPRQESSRETRSFESGSRSSAPQQQRAAQPGFQPSFNSGNRQLSAPSQRSFSGGSNGGGSAPSRSNSSNGGGSQSHGRGRH